MKKTIAILLVLVIGMVGVFAATQTKVIDLSASVDAVNKLLITTAAYTDFSKHVEAEADAAELSIVIDDMDPINVGYLTIFSNSRSGFDLSYEATALASDEVAGETRYINYSLKIGDGTAQSTSGPTNITGTLSSQDDTGEDTTALTVYSKQITITPLDFNTAVAGSDYEGTITFTFVAV